MRVRNLLATTAIAAAAALAVTVAAEAIHASWPVASALTVITGTPDEADVDAAPSSPSASAPASPDAPRPDETGIDPAVDASGLHGGLEDALARARTAADGDGIDLPVASGYRSAAEQATLLEREVAERGSLDEALHWVFRPEKSMHVRGLAIDINSGPGADWLDRHGARFGLCRTLDWEWWHFEWRDRWETAGACPAPATTPAEAPGP